MTILPRLPAHMRIITKAEHERLCVVMEPHVATRERVHDALTLLLSASTCRRPKRGPTCARRSTWCTATSSRTPATSARGSNASWTPATTDAHEGEEVVWSDTMPGAVQAWPADV